MVAWQATGVKYGGNLTKAQIITILNEAPDADSPIGRLRDAEVKGPVQQ